MSLALPGREMTETLRQIEEAGVIDRIWAGDHTVWKPDPTEIADRLGWLALPSSMLTHVDDLEAFGREARDEGISAVVLLGMGGSSLAPEVMAATFASQPGTPRLEVLDTTDPAQIMDLESRIDLGQTLFVVASKSGTTIETRSQFAYFWERFPEGRNFVVITDPGSALEEIGASHNVRRVFLNPSDIGGRYSALSFFGLVPAALIGVDIRALLERAGEMMRACGAGISVSDNPGANLGAVMAGLSKRGRDKLTLALPEGLSTLGYWIEQLVAESTGKEGLGILPVEGEVLGTPSVYGDDRLFVAIGNDPRLGELESAGHPVLRLEHEPGEPAKLGAEFFRWEFATAIVGHLLGINPFDQPNVQEAKDATNRVLDGDVPNPETRPLLNVLADVHPGDYVAITAYIPQNSETITTLASVRHAIRNRYKVATTVGFGPRFLHSTGQLHKGGANNGVFLQVPPEAPSDLEIPGSPFSFGQLHAAQALGDFSSLVSHERRVWRGTMIDLLAAAHGAF